MMTKSRAAIPQLQIQDICSKATAERPGIRPNSLLMKIWTP
jgi:hypothetical protein